MKGGLVPEVFSLTLVLLVAFFGEPVAVRIADWRRGR